MAVAGALIDRLSLTIVNALTASVALGSAYYIHLNPQIVSPNKTVAPLSENENAFIRQRFASLGLNLDEHNVTLYKSRVKRQEVTSIGIIGSLSNGHLYIPESYLLPPTASFSQAYPGLLDHADYAFAFKNRPLGESILSQEFQEARKKFMELEPVFPESYDEMDMNLKITAHKMAKNAEKEIILSGAAWIAGFTALHQVAAFAIKPVMLFPLLPCAFGIGGMVYRGWKLSEDCVEHFADSPEHAAILSHQLSAELLYNKERKKFLGIPQKWFITRTGNDWLNDLLSGPLSRKHAVAQTALLTHIVAAQEDRAKLQAELEKHFTRPGTKEPEF